jgi:hypothetical protein
VDHSSGFALVTLYIYINKDENPPMKSTRHVEANVNTQKENKNIKTIIMKWKM